MHFTHLNVYTDNFGFIFFLISCFVFLHVEEIDHAYLAVCHFNSFCLPISPSFLLHWRIDSNKVFISFKYCCQFHLQFLQSCVEFHQTGIHSNSCENLWILPIDLVWFIFYKNQFGFSYRVSQKKQA